MHGYSNSSREEFIQDGEEDVAHRASSTRDGNRVTTPPGASASSAAVGQQDGKEDVAHKALSTRYAAREKFIQDGEENVAHRASSTRDGNRAATPPGASASSAAVRQQDGKEGVGPLPPGMEIGPPRPPGPQLPAPPSGNKMAKRTSLTGRFPPGMQPEKSSYKMAKRTSPIGPLPPGMVIGPPRPPGPQRPAPPSGKSSYEKMKNILQYLFA